MNPIDEWPSPGQDARFMMTVYFHRSDRPLFETPNEIHGGTGVNAPWAEFRRGIQCGPNLYWKMSIEVGRYSIDGHEYFEEDMEIARRILESVECISDAPREKYLSDG